MCALAPVLLERLEAFPAFTLVQANMLALAPADLVRTADGALPPYKVVANLPYYITSAVLRHFLEADPPPAALVVMVQREVAERIVARPPDMSLLAVSVQFYGVPRRLFRVPPGAFHPVPKVELAVLRVDVYPPEGRPVAVGDIDAFFAVSAPGSASAASNWATAWRPA